MLTGSYDLPGARLLDLVAVMDRLRSPGGCPWDAEQTHASLLPYLLEETHEVIEAVERDDRAQLAEELGDLLLQVVFHARVAQEDPQQPFDIDDVAAGIVAKLVRRHPHVFADGAASTPRGGLADLGGAQGRREAGPRAGRRDPGDAAAAGPGAEGPGPAGPDRQAGRGGRCRTAGRAD